MAQALGTARRSLPGGQLHLATPVTTSTARVPANAPTRRQAHSTRRRQPRGCPPTPARWRTA